MMERCRGSFVEKEGEGRPQVNGLKSLKGSRETLGSWRYHRVSPGCDKPNKNQF